MGTFHIPPPTFPPPGSQINEASPNLPCIQTRDQGLLFNGTDKSQVVTQA